jgi:DNA replication protein DnaC
MPHYYKSFFTIDETYRPTMRRENLLKSPEMWLNFYPHSSFIEFLRSLLNQMDSDKKSVWLTGAFGTGKTFAALVLQKLFNADDTQFEQYFEKRKNKFSSNTIYCSLKKFREDGVLVIFKTITA